MKKLNEQEINNILSTSSFRLYEDNDFNTLVQYLIENWNLGYKDSNIDHKLAGEIYAHLILSESQIMVVDKKQRGFASYQNKFISDDTEFQKYHKRKFNEYINKFKILKNYYEDELDIEEKQKSLSNNYLQLLIVGEQFKGEHLGKKLFDKIIELEIATGKINEDKMNFNELSIYTTTKCNYHFYDHIGCKIKYIKQNEDEDSMIYSYKI